MNVYLEPFADRLSIVDKSATLTGVDRLADLGLEDCASRSREHVPEYLAFQIFAVQMQKIQRVSVDERAAPCLVQREEPVPNRRDYALKFGVLTRDFLPRFE